MILLVGVFSLKYDNLATFFLHPAYTFSKAKSEEHRVEKLIREHQAKLLFIQ